MSDDQRDSLELGDHIYSISAPEHRALRNAAGDAARDGQVTWLTEDGRRIAAIVPVEVAVRALGAPGPAGSCSACGAGRHEDCVKHHRGSEHQECGCDQRELHGRIFADQVALYSATRRHR